jgi:hypothetical protein
MPEETSATRTVLAVRAFGLAMAAIGLAAYTLASPAHWTALIPAVIGVLALAATLSARRPLLTGGIAAALAALALFGSAGALQHLPALLSSSETVANPAAVAARSASTFAAVALLAALAAIRPWRR